jgi:transposase
MAGLETTDELWELVKPLLPGRTPQRARLSLPFYGHRVYPSLDLNARFSKPRDLATKRYLLPNRS